MINYEQAYVQSRWERHRDLGAAYLIGGIATTAFGSSLLRLVSEQDGVGEAVVGLTSGGIISAGLVVAGTSIQNYFEGRRNLQAIAQGLPVDLPRGEDLPPLPSLDLG